MDNDTQHYNGETMDSPGVPQGYATQQRTAMNLLLPTPGSIFEGINTVSRYDADLEIYPNPMGSDSYFSRNGMTQNLPITGVAHQRDEQSFMTNAGYSFINNTSAFRHNSVQHPHGEQNYYITGNDSELSTQDVGGTMYQSNAVHSIGRPFPGDLPPSGPHYIPTEHGLVNTASSFSTGSQQATRGDLTGSSVPSPTALRTPYISILNFRGNNYRIGRRRTRRGATAAERARTRALIAAGGACETHRRNKKKCIHDDDEPVVSARAPAPASAETSAPPLAPGRAPQGAFQARDLIATQIPQVRQNFDDISSLTATFGQQHAQHRNQSLASLHGYTPDQSMFSVSAGGVSANGSMSSAEPTAYGFATNEALRPEIRIEGQLDLDTIGLGQQFHGQLARNFDRVNDVAAEHEFGILDAWIRVEHRGMDEQ